MTTKKVVVDATFRDVEQHFHFRRVYGSRSAFLRALSRSSKVFLVNAVDLERGIVVRNENLNAYRSMK